MKAITALTNVKPIVTPNFIEWSDNGLLVGLHFFNDGGVTVYTNNDDLIWTIREWDRSDTAMARAFDEARAL